MRPTQRHISWVNWAIAGTAQTGIVYANDAKDRLLDLIEKCQMSFETPSSWYRLEWERTWLGHTIHLCGIHALDCSADRASACESLTRLIETIAASTLPFEQKRCRHEPGDCLARPTKTSGGLVCNHSLQIELVHPFTMVGSHRQRENECLEQLVCRLLQAGVPQIKAAPERMAA